MVAAIRSGDSGPFSLLYRRYRNRVFAFCYRMTLNPDDAEDVVQDVFLKAFKNLPSLRDPAMFRPWLFSVARREAYACLRHSRRLERLDESQELESESADPLQAVVNEETSDIVQRHVDLLKPKYRELLILREFSGLSCAEIAEVSGMCENTVRSLLFRARKALAEKLAPVVKEKMSEANVTLGADSGSSSGGDGH